MQDGTDLSNERKRERKERMHIPFDYCMTDINDIIMMYTIVTNSKLSIDIYQLLYQLIAY